MRIFKGFEAIPFIDFFISISINSIISVSQQYIEQRVITAINSSLALFCGIIGSIELFLGINQSMEVSLGSSKDYYILSCDIYKVLSLNGVNRPDSKTCLEEFYGRYIKLYESSYLLDKKLCDNLANLPSIIIRKHSCDNGSSGDDSGLTSDDDVKISNTTDDLKSII